MYAPPDLQASLYEQQQQQQHQQLQQQQQYEQQMQTPTVASNGTRIPVAIVSWLRENFSESPDTSLGREVLYGHFCDMCKATGQDVVNPASFGKIIRSVFPQLDTRRLGTRGNSKYHYYGIKCRETSTLKFPQDQIGGAHHRFRGRRSTAPSKTDPSAPNLVMSEYIDVSVELPPPLESRPAFREIAAAIHGHFNEILDCVKAGEFQAVEDRIYNFWSSDGPDLELLRQEAGCQLFAHCLQSLVNVLSKVLMVNVVVSMPEPLTKEMRHFGKNVETWFMNAYRTRGILEPETLSSPILQKFARALRRYTSLNHLSQAARSVLTNPEQVKSMHAEIGLLDFEAIQAQAGDVTQCDGRTVEEMNREFMDGLQNNLTVEDWAEWLQLKTADYLQATHSMQARSLVTRWSYFGSLVIRDLTLRSASSFGSFHLIRLFFDEYMMYLAEQIEEHGDAVLRLPPGQRRNASDK